MYRVLHYAKNCKLLCNQLSFFSCQIINSASTGSILFICIRFRWCNLYLKKKLLASFNIIISIWKCLNSFLSGGTNISDFTLNTLIKHVKTSFIFQRKFPISSYDVTSNKICPTNILSWKFSTYSPTDGHLLEYD